MSFVDRSIYIMSLYLRGSTITLAWLYGMCHTCYCPVATFDTDIPGIFVKYMYVTSTILQLSYIQLEVKHIQCVWRLKLYSIFFYKTHNWPKDLVQNVLHAASILKRYDTEQSFYLHISFDYYCCCTVEESSKIGAFAKNSYPVEVSPHLLVCVIHVPEDMASLVLMVEENSQNSLLQRLTLDAEQDLEAKICR